MESPFETIAVVVDKGIVPAGIDVVIAWSFDGAGGVSVSGTVIEKIRKHGPLGVYVACNPRQDLNSSKPDWIPPKLKKGLSKLDRLRPHQLLFTSKISAELCLTQRMYSGIAIVVNLRPLLTSR